jgi:hypothetical protein
MKEVIKQQNLKIFQSWREKFEGKEIAAGTPGHKNR